MKKILVTYGSKKGSTKGIAERIAEVVMMQGYSVDIKDIESTNSVESYDAVVIGSSMYIGQWHKKVVKYLEANKDQLSNKPLWLFSSGPTGEGDPLEFTHGKKYPDKLENLIQQIKPKEIAVFHGSLKNEDMNFIEKWMISKVKAPIGDFRQWDMIETWAENIGVN